MQSDRWRLVIVISASGLLALSTSLCSAASAAPGDLDQRFGDGGLSFLPSQVEAFDAALLENGSIVVGGQDLLAPYAEGAGIVARYRSDGSLDTTYGTDGVATTPPRALLACEAFTVTPDGGTVCAYTDGSGNEGVVARFRRGGALDRSFGDGGFAITDRVHFFASVAVQPDGRILAGSPAAGGGQIVRFTTDGALDATFAADGVLGDVSADPPVDGREIALQPDGKILVTATTRSQHLVRLKPDGTPDSTFGRDGESGRIGILGAEIRRIAAQPDGGIIVVGRVPGPLWLVARYNANGTLDRSFGELGTVVSRQGSYAADVGILPDGRIAVGGRGPRIDGNFKLLVYRPNGTPDRTFGTNGRAQVQVGAPNMGGPVALIVQPDGKVVLVGTALADGTGSFKPGIALVRFLT
jgi:uncharacterized delta-60 repeat protein